MIKKDRLERLSNHFLLLLSILRKEGTPDTIYAESMIEAILNALKLPYSSDREIEDLLDEIRIIYDSLYPPRGGLTEFFIWREDFKERFALNSSLKKVKHKIDKILTEK